MKKKVYSEPLVVLIELETLQIICTSSEVRSIDGNCEFDMGGAGAVPARSPRPSIWDE